MKGTITVRISEELIEEIERLVKDEGTTKSDLIRDALKKYVAAKKFRRLRNRVLPFAEAQGLITDEDVFGSIS